MFKFLLDYKIGEWSRVLGKVQTIKPQGQFSCHLQIKNTDKPSVIGFTKFSTSSLEFCKFINRNVEKLLKFVKVYIKMHLEIISILGFFIFFYQIMNTLNYFHSLIIQRSDPNNKSEKIVYAQAERRMELVWLCQLPCSGR